MMRERLEGAIAARIARAARKFNKAKYYIVHATKGLKEELDALATDVDPESDALGSSGLLVKYRRSFIVSEDTWNKIVEVAGGDHLCDDLQIIETDGEKEKRYKVDFPLIATRFADGRARRILATQVEGDS